MLELKVTNQDIKLIQVTPLGNPLVSDSRGEYECFFEFDNSWANFTKTAIFSISSDSMMCDSEMITDIKPLENDKCIIPKKILKPNMTLRIGVFGIKDNIERPTVYAPPLLIRQGAIPGNDIPDPEPSVYLEIVEIMNKTQQIAQSVRDDADNGKFDGEPGKGVPSGGTEGQFLRIVGGKPAWATVPDAKGVSFGG